MRKCSVCGARIEYTADGILRRKIYNPGALYPRFAIEPGELPDYVYANTEKCGCCGYVATNLEEKTGITQGVVKKLGEHRDKCYWWASEAFEEEVVELCYEMAVNHQYIDCNLTAAKWYLYAGILCEEEYIEKHTLHKIFYRQAMLLLKQELKQEYHKQDFELRLAFANLLRLNCLYEECAKEIDMCQREIIEEKRYKCDALDMKLLGSIKELANKMDDEYLTYMQIIGVDGICITKPKRRCPGWTEG